MAGIFDLKKSGTQYMFNLKSAENGQTVLTSERYTTKQSAKDGIDSVKANAPSDSRYQRKNGTNGCTAYQPIFPVTSLEVMGVVVGVARRVRR